MKFFVVQVTYNDDKMLLENSRLDETMVTV